MIEFVNGPAKGTSLNLQRTPVFLRVVIDPKGMTVDALDQLDDTPKENEALYAYKLAGTPGRTFFCSREKGCQVENSADYELCAQPPDDVMRDNDKWAAWCTNQAESDIKKARQHNAGLAGRV